MNTLRYRSPLALLSLVSFVAGCPGRMEAMDVSNPRPDATAEAGAQPDGSSQPDVTVTEDVAQPDASAGVPPTGVGRAMRIERTTDEHQARG